MSARYSNSPSLRLVIAESRIYRGLHCLLCLLAACGLYRLSLRGYPLLALVLLLPVILACWRLARQRHAGSCISWQRGEWSLERRSSSRGISLSRASTCLPWVVYLAWTEAASAQRGSVFLFADSAPGEQLRGLRVRISLER